MSPELGNRVQRVRVQLPGTSQELLAKLREKKVDVAAHAAGEDGGAVIASLLGNLAFPLLLVGGLFLLSRRGGGVGGPGGGPGNPLAFGKSKAKFQMEPNTGVTFDDVAGVDEAKQDFMEVVEFLKRPERFTAVGAKIPKGVLLAGPPGTGKTLLAKAIAGEAGVPFFSISGSEFVEMFVGVGASRVRDLFKKAKENAPCIVFVGKSESQGKGWVGGLQGGRRCFEVPAPFPPRPTHPSHPLNLFSQTRSTPSAGPAAPAWAAAMTSASRRSTRHVKRSRGGGGARRPPPAASSPTPSRY